MTKNIKTVLSKHKWLIVGLIFLYPFYCPLINKISGLNLGELYTFNLPQTEFMTVWFALGGIFGVVYNIILTQKRITIQENQQYEQKVQFTKQIEKQDNQIEIQQKNFDAQIKKQDDQIQIQQKQLRDTRFSSGVELLGNQNESARIGGAYNLYFLANEYPNEYLNPVCEILCAHIRTITSSKEYQETYKEKASNEIQTIINMLFREKNDKGNFIFNECNKNLAGTFLFGVNFSKAKINKVNFLYAQISTVKYTNGSFQNTILSDVVFFHSTLRDVFFTNAILNNVSFSYSQLSNINFEFAQLSKINFNNAQLNKVDFKSTVLSGVNFCTYKNSDALSNDNINAILDSQMAARLLCNVDFFDATLNDVNFEGTVLQNYSNEEITREGRSLELTNKESSVEAYSRYYKIKTKKDKKWTTNW